MNDLQHIHQPPALAQILTRTADLKFDMPSEPRTGALLRTLAASKPAGRFLELGTGTGIATAWLLDGMDAASVLTSVDVNPIFQDVARGTFSTDHRLTLVAEDALAFLKRQPAASFDLVFADALAGKYDGLDEALRVVKAGGFYVIDDMLPQPNWPDGHALKVSALIATLAAHPGFQVIPLAWASGIVIGVRKQS